jgi:hypothetical protein
MPLPWLQLIDAALGVANFARSRKAPPDDTQAVQAAGAPGGIEARLASVVVAALKEAFDRDSRRLELEREQMAAERQRAERALRLELQRQAGDREIGRLRLIAGVAGTAWIATLVMAGRLAAGAGPRVTLGVGWLFLLGAVAAAFTAQSRVAEAMSGGGDASSAMRPGASGALALWLLTGGLILCSSAALLT